jgi:hypothetical protein
VKRICRQFRFALWRRRKLTSADFLRHARIVTDPEKMAYLNASVKRRDELRCSRLMTTAIETRLRDRAD